MSKKDKEGFTPMPESEEQEPSTRSERDRTRVEEGSTTQIKKSMTSKEAQEYILERADGEGEESSLGVVVGALIIIGVLVIGGVYLFLQTGYLTAPNHDLDGNSGQIKTNTLPVSIKNLPPPPPPPSIPHVGSDGTTTSHNGSEDGVATTSNATTSEK